MNYQYKVKTPKGYYVAKSKNDLIAKILILGGRVVSYRKVAKYQTFISVKDFDNEQSRV